MIIKQALISVYDKSGIVDFASELENLGIKIIATNGTYKILKESRIKFLKKVSDITNFPEILDGRVKTEHPKIIAGILTLKEKKEHLKELKKLNIKPIDIVVSNLYPFNDSIHIKTDFSYSINNIDIGGPNIIRAAAKNFKNVIVIVNPSRYNKIIKKLVQEGDIDINTRLSLAIEAFKLTANYDSSIKKFLEKRTLIDL
jgi:phosphoribosylaminoimidazolecarboxamide formyltransferase/IMP cyclohydrolase